MFGRKPPSPNETTPASGLGAAPMQAATPARPMTPTAPSRPAALGETAVAAPRPAPAPSQPIRKVAESVRSEAPASREVRKLIVGRGIAFSGEISACDDLIVEGTVEARLPGGHRIEITETGLFRGTVEIDEADIGGRFEGEITVKGRLTIRSTGHIEGKIQYGELAVEAGGGIQGDIQSIAKKPEPKAGIRLPEPVAESAPETSAMVAETPAPAEAAAS